MSVRIRVGNEVVVVGDGHDPVLLETVQKAAAISLAGQAVLHRMMVDEDSTAYGGSAWFRAATDGEVEAARARLRADEVKP